MQLLYFFIIFLVLLGNGIHLKAQIPKHKYNISGNLIDAETEKPLSYANIGILNQDSVFVKGTTSDEKGFFIIRNLDSGVYFIRISFLGYSQNWLPIILFSDTAIEKFKVAPATQQLNEVEVITQKPMYQFDADKKIYNVTEDVSVQNGVANDALQNAPGVWVDMEGNITLRGVSGVEIWINDKPSRLNGEGLKNYLQQLPANSIERIEVINNPGAKYKASGTGGIINIITKSKIKKNELLSFGLNASTRPSYSPWASYVWSNQKWKYSGYFNFSQSSRISSNFSDGFVKQNADTVYRIISNSSSEHFSGFLSTYHAVEYKFSDYAGIELYGGFYKYSYDSKSLSDMEKYYFSTLSQYQFSQNYKGDNASDNFNGGLSFTQQLQKKDDHKIIMDVFFHQNSYLSEYQTNESYLSNALSNYQYKQKKDNYGKWFEITANYENQINDNKNIEAGITMGYDLDKMIDNVDTFDFDKHLFLNVPLYEHNKKNSNNEYEIYFTYTDKLWKIKYKVGLRSEYQMYQIIAPYLKEPLQRNFLGFFPSLNLSYATERGHNFSINYSYRVNYPTYQLDPFVNYTNKEGIYSGNPDLKPSFSNRYEIGYSKYFKSGSSINLSMYHRITENPINRAQYGVYDTVIKRFTILSNYVNAGRNQFIGGEITFTYRPVKYLNFMWNTNLYYNKMYAKILYETIDREMFSYNSKLNITGTIKKKYRLQLNGVYNSKQLEVQGSNDVVYYVNFSASADFLKRKISARMGIQDIFDMQKSSSVTNSATYSGFSKSKQTTKFITAGITFRFGKIELENFMKTGGGAPAN